MPDNGGPTAIFSFQDQDGDSGADPVVSVDTLLTNTTYSGSIDLLNESENPVVDISPEVAEEGLDHQFFFQTTVSGLSISYDDADAANNPIGLKCKIQTTDTQSGTLTIILRHEPDKNAPGVADGEIELAGGETDIQVTFEVEVRD
ncbi:MAG: type 1 periplasmic binding fold superfamily protein [Bacteroidia bacterium]